GPSPMHEALCRSSGTTLDSVHAEDGPPITQRTSGLGEADGGGFRTFRALGDIDDDALSLIERGQPRPLQRGGVHEHVLAAAVAHDKAEALGRVVPLDRAVLRRGRLERRPLARAETPGPRPPRPGGAA